MTGIYFLRALLPACGICAILSTIFPADAQTAASSAAPGTASSSFTVQGPAESSPNIPSGSVRDPLGRLCYETYAVARAHIVDPSVYDHIISLKNNCTKPLKLKACYFNSDRCTPVDLRPYTHTEVIIGTMKNVRFFRYVIR